MKFHIESKDLLYLLNLMLVLNDLISYGYEKTLTFTSYDGDREAKNIMENRRNTSRKDLLKELNFILDLVEIL